MPAQFSIRVGPRMLGERLAAPVAETFALAGDPAGTDEEQVVAWLTRLHELRGVPFSYLIPDIAMLPPDSIRFFQVDVGWVEALLDGAFSIGYVPAANGVAAAAAPAFKAAAREGLGAHRAALVETAMRASVTGDSDRAYAATPGAPEALTGFLVRSAVVSSWPGIEVRGFADVAATQPLPLVRLENVAPATLLCLFGGVLARVDLQEPSEGVHFGVDRADPDGWRKALRYADGDAAHEAGTFIDGVSVPVPMRGDGTSRVIRLADAATAMSTLVWAGPEPASGFTAAEFGLEMVEGIESVSFRIGAAP